jgi:hypothetical protein
MIDVKLDDGLRKKFVLSIAGDFGVYCVMRYL